MSVHSSQLSDYLMKLPATTFRKLYQQPSTAFAIFRSIDSSLAKTFIRALLYMPSPLPLAQLQTWVRPRDKFVRDRDRALSILRSLHIVTITPSGKDRPQELYLTTNFRNSLRQALEGGADHNSFGVPSTLPADPAVDIAFLDAYARKKLEDILHYVVNAVGADRGGKQGGGLNTTVKNLMQAGRLVERRANGAGGIAITQAGFTFLLQEANAQVWTLLLLWLEAVDTSANTKGGAAPGNLDSIEMLSFLFMLANLELGRAYDTSALPEPRRNMLPALVDFGLIYIPRDNTRQYFPTRLATTLTSPSAPQRSVASGFAAAATAADASNDASGLGASPGTAKGSIIVETNHRIYAYTSSPLQIAVLALFTELGSRFPNLVTGRLSRDSISAAISYGITAEQIISYLETHAHPQMALWAKTADQKSLLPPTVMDQIKLWQLENERMAHIVGFLFKDFDSPEEYADLCRYASEIGVLEWKSDKRGMFFASKHEQLRDYLKSRKGAK
ncbi:RNA polymerase II transcription factor B subunit 2 [Echria macrotheca]|uniref:RNA polymerase II transcription factor B subunit 2 n=1 Tax=Echria macrotheca TaxID=438768 RepID=A0AAJ0BC12_9PEZI|nr:RNA polymerase II transcription factor B subunit 2 [Echria macrotheca]